MFKNSLLRLQCQLLFFFGLVELKKTSDETHEELLNLCDPVSCLLSVLVMKVMRINTALSRKREQRVLLLVVTMVVCYLLCWLPYGIMALVATFGEPGLVTPEASIVPSLLAKMSTVINPVIYIFMNKQVRTITKTFYINVSESRSSNHL